MIEFENAPSIILPYKSIFLRDEFFCGGLTSGTIGELGWSASGTINALAGELNRPGLYRLETGAVSGTHARFNSGSGATFHPTNTHTIFWLIRITAALANTTIRIGSASSVAGAPPNNGIYFEKLDDDTNWFAVTRASSVETRTDTGIAVSTGSFVSYMYRRTSSGVTFAINGTPAVINQAATIPTATLAAFCYIINSTAASKILEIDYASLHFKGLGR